MWYEKNESVIEKRMETAIKNKKAKLKNYPIAVLCEALGNGLVKFAEQEIDFCSALMEFEEIQKNLIDKYPNFVFDRAYDDNMVIYIRVSEV